MVIFIDGIARDFFCFNFCCKISLESKNAIIIVLMFQLYQIKKMLNYTNKKKISKKPARQGLLELV